MKSLVEECFELRADVAAVVESVFGVAETSLSEQEIAQRIGNGTAALSNVLPAGWYDPPPGGVAVLFDGPENNFDRTRFDTLRHADYWPKSGSRRETESAGIVYVSPVSTEGIIGDWGATLYTGKDEAVRRHIAACLATIEDLAEYAEAGMEFGDISRQADIILAERQLTTDRTVLTNGGDATGTNCGHSIPFSDRRLSSEEQAIIQSGDSRTIAKLISNNRIFINAGEAAHITDDIAFTIELRLESLENRALPNTFFHLIVGIQQGKKTILGGFNPFFAAVGMDYLRSRY